MKHLLWFRNLPTIFYCDVLLCNSSYAITQHKQKVLTNRNFTQSVWQIYKTRHSTAVVQGPISQRDLSPDLDLNLRLWS